MKSKSESLRRELKARQIVGFSLRPDLAAAVKVEAARRNISLRDLFGEMWTLYKAERGI